MKLASFVLPAAIPRETGRQPRLGLVVDDGIAPVAALDEALPGSMAELCALGMEVLDEIAAVAATSEPLKNLRMAIDEVELLAPVPRPGKIVAVGVNYASHAREQNREPPDHPVLFAKLTTSVIGPGAEFAGIHSSRRRSTTRLSWPSSSAAVVGGWAERRRLTTCSVTPASTT